MEPTSTAFDIVERRLDEMSRSWRWLCRVTGLSRAPTVRALKGETRHVRVPGFYERIAEALGIAPETLTSTVPFYERSRDPEPMRTRAHQPHYATLRGVLGPHAHPYKLPLPEYVDSLGELYVSLEGAVNMPLIQDGDVLIVRPSAGIHHNRLCILDLGEGPVCRRILWDGDDFYAHALNQSIPPVKLPPNTPCAAVVDGIYRNVGGQATLLYNQNGLDLA